jgi:hypothetical protein
MATGALLTLLCEFVLGFGVTLGWAAWMPENTLRYVDLVDNGSLVRLVREVLPGVSPALIALALLLLLTLPLLRRFRQGEWLRPLLPVILLVSPLSWRHYMGLIALDQLSRVELVCLALAGVTALLVGSQVLPTTLAPVMQVPLLLVLLLRWYSWVRYQPDRDKTTAKKPTPNPQKRSTP